MPCNNLLFCVFPCCDRIAALIELKTGVNVPEHRESGYEGEEELDLMSSSMKYDPQKTYKQLLLLSPKKELETKVILKQAIAAGRTSAEPNGIGSSIPKQTILVNMIALTVSDLPFRSL